MGQVASSKVCCCWHNSSTRLRPLKSKKAAEAAAALLEDEEFQSAREGNTDLRTLSARSLKAGFPGEPSKGHSSTRGTGDLEASDIFASIDSTVPKPSDPAWEVPSPTPAAPYGSEVDPTFSCEGSSRESFVQAVKNADPIPTVEGIQLNSYTSTSADGGRALSSYAESAVLKPISRAPECLRETQATPTLDNGTCEPCNSVIYEQLKLLDIDPKFEISINEVWRIWFETEARRFYAASCSLLRARQLPDDWFAEGKMAIRPDTAPTIEETLWIYRFVVARQGHVDLALEMLKADLTWREETNVEALSQESVSQSFKEALCLVYPHGYYGCDKSGRPVYYDRLGSINAKKLLEDFSHQEIERYWTRGYELLLRLIFPACSVASSKRVYRGLTVLDLHGVTMGTFTKARELLTVLIHVSQNHYPECMEKTYIIRSGWAFRAMWRLVKPLLSPETAHKVQFIDTGRELEVLRDEIDTLPPFIENPNDRSIEWCLHPVGPWTAMDSRIMNFSSSFAPLPLCQ